MVKNHSLRRTRVQVILMQINQSNVLFDGNPCAYKHCKRIILTSSRISISIWSASWFEMITYRIVKVFKRDIICKNTIRGSLEKKILIFTSISVHVLSMHVKYLSNSQLDKIPIEAQVQLPTVLKVNDLIS